MKSNKRGFGNSGRGTRRIDRPHLVVKRAAGSSSRPPTIVTFMAPTAATTATHSGGFPSQPSRGSRRQIKRVIPLRQAVGCTSGLQTAIASLCCWRSIGILHSAVLLPCHPRPEALFLELVPLSFNREDLSLIYMIKRMVPVMTLAVPQKTGSHS